MSQRQVRIGIVGLGNMGGKHARHIADLPHTALAAICDHSEARLDAAEAAPEVARFSDYADMLARVELDAVLIATPHYDHPDMCLTAFARGLHVLVEKPIAVHVSEAQRLIDGYKRAKAAQPELVFAAMFMQRTWGHWRKIKSMIAAGELGRLQRCSWLITDWFRTQQYYDSGDWRATWAGEGGGVLMNQCPHNLDLYQWLVGMPARAHGFVTFGKHHRIEVEDEVTAYFEHADGAVGHFITTTGESPGTNRLEIVGELGKLVYEARQQPMPDAADPDSDAPSPPGPLSDAADAEPEAQHDDGAETVSQPDGVDAERAVVEEPEPPDDLIFYRNTRSSIDEIRQSRKGFDKVPYRREVVKYQPPATHGHELIIANFADAVLDGAELIAPAEEGINSVMLNNAIILSAHRAATIDLPIDGAEFAKLLEQYIAQPPALSS